MRDPIATLRGGVAGAVEGASSLITPLDVATAGTASVLRGPRQALRAMLPGRVAARSVQATADDALPVARNIRAIAGDTASPPAGVDLPVAPGIRSIATATPPASARTPMSAEGIPGGDVPALRMREPWQATPVPPEQPIPRERLYEFPSIQKMPEEVRGDITDLLERHQGFTSQRRGVQSIERTEALSERIDVPIERLTPGKALTAEELAAYRNAVASVLTKRQPLAEKIAAGRATDVERLQFDEMTHEAVALTASFRGAKAEAGRALNILRSRARVLEYGDAAFIEAALKAPGFAEDTARVARAVAEAGGDPLKQLQALREAGGTGFDRVAGLYYNSLLSGVKTNLRNAIGNTFNAIANTITPLGAAPADSIRARLTGAPRTVFAGEFGQNIAGAFAGLEAGFRDALFTLRHEVHAVVSQSRRRRQVRPAARRASGRGAKELSDACARCLRCIL